MADELKVEGSEIEEPALTIAAIEAGRMAVPTTPEQILAAVDHPVKQDHEDDVVVWVYDPPAHLATAFMHGVPRANLTRETMRRRHITDEQLSHSQLYRRVTDEPRTTAPVKPTTDAGNRIRRISKED